MSSESVDPQAVEATKRQIRGLVEEISSLAKAELRPEQFYTGFLQRVVEALAAVGGAVWLLAEAGQFQLAYQINLRKASLDEPGEHQFRHARLLGQVVESGEGMLVPPHSGSGDDNAGANPTEMLLVLAPLRTDKRTEGVVEIFQRPTANPATRRGYLSFLRQMCELASEWHKSYKLQQFIDRESVWTQVDDFARSVHDSLDLRQTAYTVANEAQRLIGCDRVSVAICKGSRCKIEAVSGQDLFDDRSNVVTLLAKLATRVVAMGEPLWYTGSTDGLPPQLEEAVHEYVDHSHAKTIVIVPLSRPSVETEVFPGEKRPPAEDSGPIGALVVEQIEDVRPRDLLAPRIDLVTSHASRALANATQYHGVWLLPVWRALGRSRLLFRGRTLPKTVAVLVGVLLATLAVILVPADFDLKARGELQPIKRKDVFAPREGRVIQVLVKHGEWVKEGQALAELENSDLDVRLDDITGQLHATAAQRQSAEIRMRNPNLPEGEKIIASGEALTYEKREESLGTQLRTLIKQKEQLKVTSPIEGRVMSWDVENTLIGRNVDRTNVLMKVADTEGAWELELYMPENRMGHIAAARQKLGDPLQVQYITADDPASHRKGQVREIHAAAQLHEEHGHAVWMLVDIDQQDLKNRFPGATVTAKVHCGRRSIGYVWLHDVLEWFQSRVLFHL